ncbi:hypothetical protein FACS1894219_08790 [Clostridia bacterium]|nr:hypothetical protein FACS1894219_08790 [Clostridia bacterium]
MGFTLRLRPVRPSGKVVAMDRRKIEKAIKIIVVIVWLMYTLKMNAS